MLPIINVGALMTRVGCSSTKLVAARAIDRACRETGFFYVCNHGVDEVLRARVLELGRRFFELPQASKDAISIANSSSFRGYQRMGENVTQGLPDWHEGIDWFRDEEGQPLPPGMDWFQLAGANQWPSEVEVPGFRAAYGAYVSCMLDLGGAVMRGVALGLGKEAHFFEPWYTRSFWVMRLIGYPTLSGGDGGGGGGGGSGNGGDGSGGGGGGGGGDATDGGAQGIGCGAHTDYGCLTLLHADDTPGCLQVRTLGGQWSDAPTVPGAFLVNIGDMLQVWSAGQYRSTEHRVLHPHDGYRVSVPFFFEPNADALITPVVQPAASAGTAAPAPIVYGEHLQRKVLNNFAHDIGVAPVV